MKVSEFRLGNYILHNGEVMPVVQIERRYKTIYRLNDMDVDERIIEDHFNPIPITPALLYSVGFSTPPNHLSTIVYKDGVTIDYHHGKFRLRDNSRITIDYLHQLQNLYFALTGEELTINHEHLQIPS